MSGYEVLGNTFKDSWAGVKLGGGRRVKIKNNTFSFIHNGVEFDNRGQTWQKTNCDPAYAHNNTHSFYAELARDKVSQPPWEPKWPYLQHIAEDHPCVPVYNNISENRFCELDVWITASPADISKWLSTASGNVNYTGCKLGLREK